MTNSIRPTDEFKEKYRCANCFKTEVDGVRLRRCGQCQSVFYCSKKCQRKDWGKHKTVCKITAAKNTIQVSKKVIKVINVKQLFKKSVNSKNSQESGTGIDRKWLYEVRLKSSPEFILNELLGRSNELEIDKIEPKLLAGLLEYLLEETFFHKPGEKKSSFITKFLYRYYETILKKGYVNVKKIRAENTKDSNELPINLSTGAFKIGYNMEFVMTKKGINNFEDIKNIALNNALSMYCYTKLRDEKNIDKIFDKSFEQLLKRNRYYLVLSFYKYFELCGKWDLQWKIMGSEFVDRDIVGSYNGHESLPNDVVKNQICVMKYTKIPTIGFRFVLKEKIDSEKLKTFLMQILRTIKK